MNLTREMMNSAFLKLPGKPFFAAKKTDHHAFHVLMSSLRPVNTQTPLIRIGPKNDGGYLVPDDLSGIGCVFSPGVSYISGFEMQCAEKGLDVYLADASVDKPSQTHPRFHFIKRFIGAFNDDQYITMEDWVNLVMPDESRDWLLQMDIEGAEYEVVLNMPEKLLERFRIIIIEFHMLDYLMDEAFFKLASRVFAKLLKYNRCVHIHPNNAGGIMRFGDIILPKMMEFTFYRRDRIKSYGGNLFHPHPLDEDNVPEYPPIALPKCWLQ